MKFTQCSDWIFSSWYFSRPYVVHNNNNNYNDDDDDDDDDDDYNNNYYYNNANNNTYLWCALSDNLSLN